MFLRRLIHRPRYADVAATLALVLAMSGTAYAVATTAAPNSVNTAAIQNGAVTTPKIATEAVTNGKIEPGAVTAGKLAAGSVTHAKIGANAVTSGDVKNNSLSLSDIAGVDQTGTISFTLSANGCGNLILSVTGARVGQSAIFTWVGTTNPPAGVVLGPLKVVQAGRIVASACNLTGQQISASGVKIRITTFG
jgi:hypothetical protein